MFYIEENPRNKTKVNILKTAEYHKTAAAFSLGDTQWKISIPKQIFEEHKSDIHKFEQDLDLLMFNHKMMKQPLPDYIHIISKCQLND